MERIVKQSWYGNSEFGLSGTFRNQNGMVSRSLEDFSLDDNISRVAMTINDIPIIASTQSLDFQELSEITLVWFQEHCPSLWTATSVE
jgi:hypothetical protein